MKPKEAAYSQKVVTFLNDRQLKEVKRIAQLHNNTVSGHIRLLILSDLSRRSDRVYPVGFERL
mgnify:CR=1 FL=1